MIKLDVKDYCHNCRAFDPIAEDIVNDWGDQLAVHVRCSNWKRCDKMEKYIRRQIEKEQENV